MPNPTLSAKALHVVICWHMHQPDYRDALGGRFQMPWTYLHAIKDYADMAAHVEQTPEATAVFDFSPVLLDQIEEIAKADLNATRLILDSQDHAISFYEKSGYAIKGEGFLDAGIPHHFMEKSL